MGVGDEAVLADQEAGADSAAETADVPGDTVVAIFDFDFDPLFEILKVQAVPVLLLALGVGTPLVSSDRAEDVLFLYATRPVTPWSYALGKMATVAVPAFLLLLLPGILSAVLRQGLLVDFGWVDSLLMVLYLTISAAFMAWGYAGVAVGSSAAVTKSRWALLLALGCFAIPKLISVMPWGADVFALDPGTAIKDMLAMFFADEDPYYGITGGLCLVVWGALGTTVTALRVQREMTP